MADKKVDESWKQQIETERRSKILGPSGQPVDAGPAEPAQPAPPSGPPAAGAEAPARPEAAEGAESGMPEARFDLFVTGLAVDALIALGDMAHPTTRRTAINLDHARYLIDLLGVLEEKTRKNLSADEERLMKDTLYQLRMRYLQKTGQG